MPSSRSLLICLALLAPASGFVPTRLSVNRAILVAKPPTTALFADAVGDAPAAPAANKVTIESLEIDSMIEGTVKTVSDFGAFVDYGGSSDGLVHKSQLDDSFVENPAEFVSVGQKVTVRVIRVDLDKGQVSFSMKSKDAPRGGGGGGGGRRGPDLSTYAAMGPKDTLTGKVKTIASYGAFVELPDGASGLVHISQLEEGRVETVESVLAVGDAVTVRVLNVENNKLSLTMIPYKEGMEQSSGEDDLFGGKKEEEFMLDRERDSTDNFPVEDIWSDNTEPEWEKIVDDTSSTFVNGIDFSLITDMPALETEPETVASTPEPEEA